MQLLIAYIVFGLLAASYASPIEERGTSRPTTPTDSGKHPFDIKMIKAALDAKASEIEAAYALKGGWEGWAQVELAIYLKGKCKGCTIEREMAVYAHNSKLLADLVITPAAGQAMDLDNTAIIELKCRNVRHQDFVQKVETDLAKIDNELVAPYDKVHGVIKVVAIGTGNADENAAFDKKHTMQQVKLDAKVDGKNMILWYTGFDVPGAPKKPKTVTTLPLRPGSKSSSSSSKSHSSPETPSKKKASTSHGATQH